MIGKNSLEHYYKRKKIFTVNLNMEDVTDADYMHAISVSKDFKTKRNQGKYNNMYVQSNALLLADVFNNFQSMCVEIYGLDSAHFLPAPGLTWQADLSCKWAENIIKDLLVVKIQ